jgi:vacuolar-type H+-ATPase subunit C/Vma6
MPGAGERAYVYAKACGIIGKSFIGKRIDGLGGVNRLSELDRLIFPNAVRDLPEKELLRDLEDRIIRRSVKEIVAVVDSFSKPPELLVLLIRAYEYADLKGVLNVLAGGETTAPAFTGIGRYNTVNFSAYPDLAAMLKGTEFEFLTEARKEDQSAGGIHLQTELDRLYYKKLWEALFALPKGDRISAEKILREEISLRNAVWALRLRTYYNMSAQESGEKLLDIKLKTGRNASQGRGAGISLAADAFASLALALDNRSQWNGWNREGLLNPERPGVSWKADPRHFQNAASEYLYRLARRCFRLRPFSIDTAFCFIKLKQFEENILTSVAEGLGLGLSSRDVFTLLEFES